MTKLQNAFSFLITSFLIPTIIFLGIILYLVLTYFGLHAVAVVLILVLTGLGSFDLVKETVQGLLKGQYALDYIAILAIVVSLITGEYLIAAVIALMISSGRTLEEYGVTQAKKNLTKLTDRIPDEVLLNEQGSTRKVKIGSVGVGQEILVRKGEVIPLDGSLISENGLTDESSLTGEPYTIEKIKGDVLRSGTVNIGEPMLIQVTKAESDSTYTKIINLVKSAQEERAPLIRLADKYSTFFTIITFIISAAAYLYSGSIHQILAVLVVATPCPLILATPIALIGGVNASSKRRIITKKLSSLEALSRTQTIIFDKTGTITLGTPQISEIKIINKAYSQNQVLSIAEAIERNSLHPLAKAIVNHAQAQKVPVIRATEVKETIGRGISGVVEGKTYILEKVKGEGMAIGLYEGKRKVALFTFEDQLKEESNQVMRRLLDQGYKLFIYTGDKQAAAEKIVAQIDSRIGIKAECTPEDKQNGIKQFKTDGEVVAMIGDGINDAPALALADVGMVFSNEEQTAASEAADIVFLGGNFGLVSDILGISKRTVGIAMQSIMWGIGISVVAMLFAAVGLIPPLFGAILQEGIDVAVIINALRASRYE